MHKSLKFASHLVPLVLDGSKTATWRLFDEKDISVGDIVAFLEQGTGVKLIPPVRWKHNSSCST